MSFLFIQFKLLKACKYCPIFDFQKVIDKSLEVTNNRFDELEQNISTSKDELLNELSDKIISEIKVVLSPSETTINRNQNMLESLIQEKINEDPSGEIRLDVGIQLEKENWTDGYHLVIDKIIGNDIDGITFIGQTFNKNGLRDSKREYEYGKTKEERQVWQLYQDS